MSLIDNVTYHDIGDLRYAVRTAGNPDGAPMVLLHGLMDTGAGFDALATAIEAQAPQRFRFIAPDWRGHGQTTATHDSYWFPLYLLDLERLLDRCVDRAQPLTLVAHSMGGQVASLYAGTRPERVSYLVTLDSLNVPDVALDTVPQRYRRWLDAQAEPPSAKSYDDLAAVVARIAARYPELGAAQARALAEQWTCLDDGGRQRMRVDPWHLATLPYGFRAAEAMALWAEVRAPVLCIDGGDSPAKQYVSDADMAQRRACFADLSRVVLDGCGHMLHVQAPEAVATAIRQFLDARA